MSGSLSEQDLLNDGYSWGFKRALLWLLTFLPLELSVFAVLFNSELTLSILPVCFLSGFGDLIGTSPDLLFIDSKPSLDPKEESVVDFFSSNLETPHEGLGGGVVDLEVESGLNGGGSTFLISYRSQNTLLRSMSLCLCDILLYLSCPLLKTRLLGYAGFTMLYYIYLKSL